jgi:hypothetical protein
MAVWSYILRDKVQKTKISTRNYCCLDSPVRVALMTWGDKWQNDGQGPPNPLRHVSCGEITRPTLVCDHCGEGVSVGNLISEPSERVQRQRRAMLADAKASKA